MPSSSPDPALLEAVSAAFGAVSRAAGEAAEEVLAHYPTTGDRAGQQALERWVEQTAERLREIESDAADQAVELGMLARRSRPDLAPQTVCGTAGTPDHLAPSVRSHR